MGWMGVPGVRSRFRDGEEGLSDGDTAEGWGLVGAQRFSEGAKLEEGEGEGEKRSERGPVIRRISIEGAGDGAGLPGKSFGSSGWVVTGRGTGRGPGGGGTWSFRSCWSWPRRSLVLLWRPRRCSCICKRLMAAGCPAGVLLTEGGGGPDTGVAPLLRLPDPQAAEGP